MKLLGTKNSLESDDVLYLNNLKLKTNLQLERLNDTVAHSAFLPGYESEYAECQRILKRVERIEERVRNAASRAAAPVTTSNVTTSEARVLAHIRVLFDIAESCIYDKEKVYAMIRVLRHELKGLNGLAAPDAEAFRKRLNEFQSTISSS